VYTENAAIPTMNPVYSDDLYLRRILATLVAPPHTTSSLRRCLSSIENIDVHVSTRLCIATLSESSIYNCDQMSILVHSSLGYTANEPVALICNLPCANVSGPLRQPNLIAERGPKSSETRYCEWYHILYKNSARVKSKQPSHPDDFYLSRISVDYVSPPHTAKSIIRCISK
ncbi:hypothetical protein PILCRDRAFT_56272, partial [Piloderma croceum F 1598]